VVYTRQLGSNIVTPSGSLQDTFLYLLVSNSAPIVRAQDKGARIFGLGVWVRGCYLVNRPSPMAEQPLAAPAPAPSLTL